jgi:hypothetical protein
MGPHIAGRQLGGREALAYSRAMARSIVLVAVLLLVALSAGAGAAQDVRGKPMLRLAGASPLKVRGQRFLPAERVRVTVRGARIATRPVSADEQGSFVAAFQDVVVDRCSALSVLAVGSRGSQAVLKRSGPLCPPRL